MSSSTSPATTSVEWADSGPAIVESRAALVDKQRLGQLRVPDPMAPGRMRERVESIGIMRAEAGAGASIVGWVEGPLALAAEMRGLSALMMDTYEDPGFLEDLFDFTSSVGMAYWKPQVEAGADTIGMSDAAASMMSLGHYAAVRATRRSGGSSRTSRRRGRTSSCASTCAGRPTTCSRR